MYTKLFFLKAVSDVITAGVAVISFSLFVYAVTFKLRDYVTRSFVCILACIVIVFGADAFVTTTIDPSELLFILRIQYIGLIFLPTTYFHFSDALLAMTGKPSKGKRKISGYISILISLTFLFFLINGQLISSVVTSNPPAPHIARTIYHDIFTIFFIFTLLMAWYNFIRSVIRTSTATSRRRMVYLVVSAIGPAAASFPYLLYGSGFAAQNSILFWVLSIFANIFVIFSLVGMTYTVSFFGFPWPDRVIKSRLFRWIMRGPVTASITLGVTTMINRIGQQFGFDIC